MMCFSSIFSLLMCISRQLKSCTLAYIRFRFFGCLPYYIFRSLHFHLLCVLILLPSYIISLKGFSVFMLLMIEYQVQHCAAPHETFGIVEAVNDVNENINLSSLYLNMTLYFLSFGPSLTRVGILDSSDETL